jgi:quercetin dioxygenase-like cupin family protein
MIRHQDDQEVSLNEHMRGGNGTVRIENLLNAKQDEFYGKGRLFSRITLKPGCSIGYHVHENEMESFYILFGNPEYDDNGQMTVLSPGDTTLTRSGEGHGIKNPADAFTDVTFIAMILYK